MGMVAIFKMDCCGREIIFGRFRGDEMYPPALQRCRFGCPQKTLPDGRPDETVLRFVRYEVEDMISPELYATWRFPDRTSALQLERRKRQEKQEKEKRIQEDMLF